VHAVLAIGAVPERDQAEDSTAPVRYPSPRSPLGIALHVLYGAALALAY
jgi:hypothetical protein